MTDFSGLHDYQLNEKIFKAKGWTYYKDERAWKKNDGGIYFSIDYPDYTNDWRLAGELLEEMPVGFRVWRTRKHWICAKINSIWRKGSTPQRAICEAWLAWKEQG